MYSSSTTYDTSPLRNRSYSPIVTSQRNTIQVSTYVKPVEVYSQRHYTQVTPPRSTLVNMNTPPTTSSTYYSINGSAPARFNQALDQVCLLGNEMDVVRKNFELVSVELQQWKDKCALIKAIASTPPPGTSYSPQRVTQLRNDIQSQFSTYQYEINQLNSIIGSVNNELYTSTEKIKALERKVGEMNKIELEMLNAKKQALELDNRNKFQELELNDLKYKIDTKNHQNDELIKQTLIVPQLKESIAILEEENGKIISMLQQKDDQLKRSDQIHMQLTKMYQENLEKSNQQVKQIKELQSENEDFHKELEKLNQVTESVSNKNPLEEQKKRGRNNIEMSFNEEDFKNQEFEFNQNEVNSSRNKNKLSKVSATLLVIEQLQQQAKDKDKKCESLVQEKENLIKQISGQLNDIQQLKNNHLQQLENHEQTFKKSQKDQNEQIQNIIIPLQKENEQMHLEIERLNHEFKQNQYAFQELRLDKNKLENLINVERQQAQNSQLKIIKDNELKCETLTERITQIENQLNQELLKNKELFEDNKLMAEEMRALKQKSNELEYWKNKYRELKKETKALRIQFDEYRKNFIREIQNRFQNGCDQFEQYLQLIDEKFDSSRNTIKIKNSNLDDKNKQSQYFQSPSQSIQESDPKFKTRSPSKDQGKTVKQINLKTSVVTNKQQSQQNNNQSNSSMNQNPLGSINTSPIIQDRSHRQQQQNNNISNFTINTNNSSNNTRNTNNYDKYEIMNQQAHKYQNEILQTNDELDHKLEELVILKAKYEEALNRVHSNVNTTPKK